MPQINPINDNKKALLAYKEKILQDIKYYDKSIEEFRAKHKCNNYYDDGDSSDNEDYFPHTIEAGPEVRDLKLQQTMLKTCLHATQELTSLSILQSEINVLVQDPQFEGEAPVTETGTWKEVTAECRIDLVPFTITFFMHTPTRKFAPSSYRGLQVSMIKAPHEAELHKSVLHTLNRPSDAVEVVRSYAVAYRSRRTTLARLANKYAGSLFMEPHPEGGFVLKCANLLEILWRLENKWSPVAPFHHRMKFDLEYMDESYIKIITQAHKQLLDPSIQTDERTLLLSKIITTCLEARGPIDSESDLESRQTETQAEIEPKDKDSQVMAPPKSLPKKSKKVAGKDKNVVKGIEKDMSKDKENNADLAKDTNINKDMTKDKSSNKDMTKDKNSNKDMTKDKNINKDMTKDKNSNKDMTKDKNTNKDMTKDKNTNKDMTKDKNSNKDMTKDKNSNKDKTTKEKAVPQKRTVDDENTEGSAKKMKPNDDITKKTSKSKQKSDDLKKDTDNTESNLKPKGKENSGEIKKNNIAKKTKDNIVDGEIKKKSDDKTEIPKKVKSSDVNKKTKQNDNNNIIEENIQNKDNDVTKVNKKRKNVDGPQSDIANINTDNLGIKKLKSSEEIIEKNTEKFTNTKKAKNIINKNENIKNNNVNLNVTNNNINEKECNVMSKENNDEPKDVHRKKVDRKTKMSMANDKKFDLITKKITSNIEKVKNVANSKNPNEIIEKDSNSKPKNTMKSVANAKNLIANGDSDGIIAKDGNSKPKNQAKNHIDIANAKTSIANRDSNSNLNVTYDKNTEIKKQKVTQKKSVVNSKNTHPNNKVNSTEATKNKNVARTNIQTVKKVTEKNAIVIKNKEKIININKVPEKIAQNKLIIKPSKPIQEKIPNKKLTKISLKTVRNIHKSPTHKNALKTKYIEKTGNTKIPSNMFAGNTDKDGGKISKIPQKKMSPNSENILKKNMLRISPRSLPSKFKTISKDANNMMKSTNIPRLMKKISPKTSQ